MAESSASTTSTSEVKRIRSTCRGCGKMECGVWVTVQDGRAVKVEGDESAYQSNGNCCTKAQASMQAAYHPDRLRYPVKRTNPKGEADPGWVRISWDEAYATIAEKFKEKPDICNAIGAHHDEMEMNTLLAPIVQVCDAISGARPGARREIVEAYIKRLNDLEAIAMSYPGVTKTYAIQAGRELRVIVGADKMNDEESTKLSDEIQNEMTYPGQVKITVIRETRSVAYAK